MYLLFSSAEHRTDKGALDMRCDAARANYLLFVVCHIEAKVTYVLFSFNLPSFRSDPFLNGGRLRSWLDRGERRCTFSIGH